MATLELVNTGASAGTCPPTDIYTLVLARTGPVEQKPIFEDRFKPENEARMQNQIKLYFRIVGVSDDTDEELTAWLGEEVSMYVTVPKNPLHEKATLGIL